MYYIYYTLYYISILHNVISYILLYLHIYYTIYIPICINERERECTRGSRWSYRYACKGNSRSLHGGSSEACRGACVRNFGVPLRGAWREARGACEGLPLGHSGGGFRACGGACVRSSGVLQGLLRGTPAKIKEKESKESQFEKKYKEMREMERTLLTCCLRMEVWVGIYR